MEITLEVKSVDFTCKDKNGNDYAAVTGTNGELYNIFEEKDRYKFISGEGTWVSMDVTKSGQWNNVTRGSVKFIKYIPPKIKTFTPEEMKNRSACLAYAKDLVIAEKLPLGDIITKAEEFYGWISKEKTKEDGAL